MQVYLALVHNWDETYIVSAHMSKETAEEAAFEVFVDYFGEDDTSDGCWYDVQVIEVEE